jgi:DNA-binding CsgD family transcriptional regulator
MATDPRTQRGAEPVPDGFVSAWGRLSFRGCHAHFWAAGAKSLTGTLQLRSACGLREIATKTAPLLEPASCAHCVKCETSLLSRIPYQGSDVTTEHLTEREREVLVLVGKGMKGAEIGLLLGMSLWTVRDHEKHIYRKLGVSGRVEAAVWASKAGLL